MVETVYAPCAAKDLEVLEELDPTPEQEAECLIEKDHLDLLWEIQSDRIRNLRQIETKPTRWQKANPLTTAGLRAAYRETIANVNKRFGWAEKKQA